MLRLHNNPQHRHKLQVKNTIAINPLNSTTPLQCEAESRRVTGFISQMNANECFHWSEDGHLLVSSEGGQEGSQGQEGGQERGQDQERR